MYGESISWGLTGRKVRDIPVQQRSREKLGVVGEANLAS
jgi:hypothetical protein